MAARVQLDAVLNDRITPGLSRINAGIGKMVGMLGAGLAIYKGFDFIKQGVEKVKSLEQANAQLEATYRSTNGAVGIQIQGLKDIASAYAAKTKFGRADITMMEAQLTTFTNIKGVIYEEAIPAILDLSQKMGQDLKSSAVQIGKALQDPEKGITALRRVGVNFTKTQQEMVSNWVKQGEVLKAQKFILAELKTEFAGSAEAAFNADPESKFTKKMDKLKMVLGETFLKIKIALLPYLEKLVLIFMKLGEWIKKNTSLLIKLGKGIVVVFLATKAWSTALLIQKGILWILSTIEFIRYQWALIKMAASTNGVTTATYLFNTSLTTIMAKLAPLTILIAGVISAYEIFKIVSEFNHRDDKRKRNVEIEGLKETISKIREKTVALKKQKGVSDEIARTMAIEEEYTSLSTKLNAALNLKKLINSEQQKGNVNLTEEEKNFARNFGINKFADEQTKSKIMLNKNSTLNKTIPNQINVLNKDLDDKIRAFNISIRALEKLKKDPRLLNLKKDGIKGTDLDLDISSEGTTLSTERSIKNITINIDKQIGIENYNTSNLLQQNKDVIKKIMEEILTTAVLDGASLNQ